MPFDPISYYLARRKADKKHTHVRADIVDLLPIRRTDMEYPTEDVTFAYLAAIGKMEGFYGGGARPASFAVLTTDSFTDKAVFGEVAAYTAQGWIGRFVDPNNMYENYIGSSATNDHWLNKIVGGTVTTIASEAVALSYRTHALRLDVVGSTLKSTRDQASTPQITATDTSLAAGRFGGISRKSDFNDFFDMLTAKLLPPASRLRRAIAIIDVEYTGSGTEDDPHKPKVPDSLTWGAFEFKPNESATATIIVTNTNDSKVLDTISAKMAPPKTISDAITLYKKLKVEHPEWIAGKDNFMYQVLGYEEFEAFQAADFYYGFLVEHRTRPQLDQLRRAPDWEMRRTLNMWKKRLERISALTEERDKHLRKLREVEKLGW